LIFVQASLTLREFAARLTAHTHHEIFPVFEADKLLGTCSLWALSQVAPERWDTATVADITDHHVHTVAPDTDVTEALRLLLGNFTQPMLLAVMENQQIIGIVTKTDILQALRLRRPASPSLPDLDEGYATN
jgi:chloride channel protein, CIC family